MIIQGYFIGEAPYFPGHLRHEEFEVGQVRLERR